MKAYKVLRFKVERAKWFHVSGNCLSYIKKKREIGHNKNINDNGQLKYIAENIISWKFLQLCYCRWKNIDLRFSFVTPRHAKRLQFATVKLVLAPCFPLSSGQGPVVLLTKVNAKTGMNLLAWLMPCHNKPNFNPFLFLPGNCYCKFRKASTCNARVKYLTSQSCCLN